MSLIIRSIAGAALWLCLAAGTAAAQGNPVVEAFRAYQAAMEAGDLAGAEAAATTAYDAARGRSADGVQTGVLALNLASVRLERARPAEAVAPARDALRIAEAAAQPERLDPALAGLVLGRAELFLDFGKAEDRLRPLIAQARLTDPGFAAEAFLAARDLAERASAEKRYGPASRAWREASRLAPAALEPTPQLIEGLQLIETAQSAVRAERFADAVAALDRSLALLAPLAGENEGLAATAGQMVFARALAWRVGVRSVMMTREIDTPPLPQIGFGRLAGRQRFCRVEVINNLLFPRDSLQLNEVGAATLRLRFDASGKQIGVTPVGIVGSEEFADTLIRFLDRYEARATPAPGCDPQTDSYLTPLFVVIESSQPTATGTRLRR